MVASSVADGAGRRRAAEPVAQGQRGEDEADDVGPHDRRRPVVGRQQPRGAHLGGHGADAGEEDERGEGAAGWGRRVDRAHGVRECTGTRGAGADARGGKMVEVSGLEPLTFWLPARRSPS